MHGEGARVLCFPYFMFNHENYVIVFATHTSLSDACKPGNASASELIRNLDTM